MVNYFYRKRLKVLEDLSTQRELNNKIIIFDIETILSNNQHIPYLICAGVDYITSYAIDKSIDQHDLFYRFITKLLTLFKGKSKNLNNFMHIILLNSMEYFY